MKITHENFGALRGIFERAKDEPDRPFSEIVADMENRLSAWKEEFGRDFPTTRKQAIALACELGMQGIELERLTEDQLVLRIEATLRGQKRMIGQAEPEPPPKDDSTLDARAVATKVAHPEWSDQQVADHIGCRRESLFKPSMVKYKQAKAALKMTKTERYGAPNDRRRR